VKVGYDWAHPGQNGDDAEPSAPAPLTAKNEQLPLCLALPIGQMLFTYQFLLLHTSVPSSIANPEMRDGGHAKERPCLSLETADRYT
jgi:hypothetical protein